MSWCVENPSGRPVPLFFWKVCASCPERGPYKCDWLDLKRVAKPIKDARVGDDWITQQAGKRGRIAEIEDLDGFLRPSQKEPIARRIWVVIPGHPKAYPYLRYVGETFETLAMAPCGAICCESHVREVSENVHYCVAHWRSWESSLFDERRDSPPPRTPAPRAEGFNDGP